VDVLLHELFNSFQFLAHFKSLDCSKRIMTLSSPINHYLTADVILDSESPLICTYLIDCTANQIYSYEISNVNPEITVNSNNAACLLSPVW
jgi:hypothetical protein